MAIAEGSLVDYGGYAPREGSPRICVKDGVIFRIGTEYRDGMKRIVLTRELTGGEGPGSERGEYLTGPGKWDNPVIVFHGERLCAAWEAYGDNGRITVVSLDPSRLVPEEELLMTSDGERCYRPRMASDGKSLLLCYEQFYRGRYAVACRYLSDGGFSETFLAGDEDKNSQEPFLTAVGDGSFYLSYENSSPLYKDYVWISPDGDRVVIPAFGHGWRVETKAFLKGITIANDGLVRTGGSLPIDGTESAGCPRILILNEDRLFLVFCTMGNKTWRIAFSIFDNGTWGPVRDSGLEQRLRITPAAVYDREETQVIITVLDDETGRIDTAVFPVPKSKETGRTVPVASSVLVGGIFTPCPVLRNPDIREGCGASVENRDLVNRRILEYRGETKQLLWGDLHMHSNLSVCSLHAQFHCVELEEKFRHCRDVGGLDFAMCTDHDSMTDREWERTKEQAEFHNRPGIFTAFQGFEWTATGRCDPKQGHYNVLYRDSGRLYRVAEEDGSHITRLWEDMEEGDVLTIPHHPADERHTLDWNYFDPRFEPLVEIFQVRGSYEYPGNSMDPSLYRPEKMVPGATILEALEKGREFGFTSGGEHEGVGVTAVFARDNTREAIFEALRARHVYGTTGDRIFMDFRVDGVLMGGEISGISGKAPVITATIEATAPVKELRIMRDGEKVFSRAYKETQIDLSWTDHTFSDVKKSRPVHYWYLAVEQENGEIGWASPVFMKLGGK